MTTKIDQKRPHRLLSALVWSLFVKPRRGGVYFVGTIVTDTNIKGKPTNSEFIALIADKLQLQMKTAGAVNF